MKWRWWWWWWWWTATVEIGRTTPETPTEDKIRTLLRWPCFRETRIFFFLFYIGHFIFPLKRTSDLNSVYTKTGKTEIMCTKCCWPMTLYVWKNLVNFSQVIPEFCMRVFVNRPITGRNTHAFVVSDGVTPECISNPIFTKLSANIEQSPASLIRKIYGFLLRNRLVELTNVKKSLQLETILHCVHSIIGEPDYQNSI